MFAKFNSKNSTGKLSYKMTPRLTTIMKGTIENFLILIFALLFFCSASIAGNNGNSEESNNKRGEGIDPGKAALPGIIVVKFKQGVTANLNKLYNIPELEAGVINQAHPFLLEPIVKTATKKFKKSSSILVNIYLVKYSGSTAPAVIAKLLLKNPDIEYAEPHYIYKVYDEGFVPDDSLLSEQYALNKIDAFHAWDITQGDTSVVIAIVDIGVTWSHPDLYDNIWHNPHWQSDIDFPGDSIGWDFGGKNGIPDSDPDEDGSEVHGTHVAGIAAAISNNHIGIAGVAPKCRIMPVKVSRYDYKDPSTGYPLITYGFEGILYAINNGARIINCSWGGVGFSQFEQDVINYASSQGVLVVAAAGNNYHRYIGFQTPAFYDNVLSVSATDSNDIATDFTNVDNNISVSAPGKGILSTYGWGAYVLLDGTSMASPYAAGVAALVASLHPEYLPQQLREQVRISSDNIDSFNHPRLTHTLGFGRVNAYRSLTVSSPGVELSNIVLSDSAGGNSDGSFTEGEIVQVTGTLIDWLAPASNLQITLTSTDPYITIVNGSVLIGSLPTLGSYNFSNNPLSFKINEEEIPMNYTAQLLVLMQDGDYIDYKGFSVRFNQTFKQLNQTNIITTITSQGNIGYSDFPTNMQGTGFIYKPDGQNLLFEGSLIAGTSAYNVVDRIRDSLSLLPSNDFRFEELVEVKTPGAVADQEASTAFNDSNATSNRIGIEVSLHTYSYDKDSTGNFIIFEYTFHNLNQVSINNFYAGIFLDWDIGFQGANNIAAYDSVNKLGYVFNSTHNPENYVGCALIDGTSPNFTAINNPDPTTGIYGGFTKSKKWNALTGKTGIINAGPDDVSMIMSGGPVSIQSNSDATITFILTAGYSLSDLQTSVSIAKQIYNVQTPINDQLPTIPTVTKLDQNYPNPFNPTTKIQYSIPRSGYISLKVFNILGQEVATLFEGYKQPGNYEVTFNGNGLSSGVYLYRLKANDFEQTKKLVLFK